VTYVNKEADLVSRRNVLKIAVLRKDQGKTTVSKPKDIALIFFY